MRSLNFLWKADRNILVDILALLLGTNAWLAVNPVYNQSPLLVHTAPEAWALPSYMSIFSNLANVGVVLYSLKQHCCPKLIKDSTLIYFFMFMGSGVLVLMAFYYDSTTIVFGRSHSVALFVLTFLVSVIGCTSAVLFVPFMNNFPEVYLISYMIGEGLSLLVPSLVSLVQGVGNNYCVNVTSESGENTMVERTYPAKFSSQMFFLIMFVIMFITSLTFLLLNNSKSVKKERKNYINNNQRKESNVCSLESDGNNKFHKFIESKSSMSSCMYGVLLGLETVVSLFLYGVLGSIQTYSTLPYGNVAYHLGVNLSNAANPVACFVMFFIPLKQLSTIFFLTAFSTLGIIYQVVMASLSPAPPLQNNYIGGVIVVTVYIVTVGLLAYLKLSIASLFHREGGRGLFWYGIVTQAGAALGAVISFYIVSYAELFKSYDICNS